MEVLPGARCFSVCLSRVCVCACLRCDVRSSGLQWHCQAEAEADFGAFRAYSRAEAGSKMRWTSCWSCHVLSCILYRSLVCLYSSGDRPVEHVCIYSHEEGYGFAFLEQSNNSSRCVCFMRFVRRPCRAPVSRCWRTRCSACPGCGPWPPRRRPCSR